MRCFNINCQLCPKLIISTAVTVTTVNGTDTLVINIPEAIYRNGSNVCLVIAQAIPTTATIGMPVAISIGGDTTTVYPIVGCNCSQVTVCAIRTRRRYPLRVALGPTTAVFRSLGNLSCSPNTAPEYIPVATTTPAT